ncbi:MAG: YHS domain-containing protein [Chloroflexi bacterium]|nr:YHS domain-containing protein [Chloroflexota bacterium]
MDEQANIIESVCGGALTDPEKYPSAEYHGERVYFCTRACLRVFLENPDGFMNGEVDHPTEEE